MAEPKENLLLHAYLCGMRMGYRMSRVAETIKTAPENEPEPAPEPSGPSRIPNVFAWAKGDR